jgi:hypothetical protein
MKVGTENRKEIAALAVLALVAAIVLGRMYMGKPTVSARVPVPTVTATPAIKKPTTQGRSGKKGRKLPLVTSLDPTLRFDLLKSSEEQEYTGGKRNIFQPQAEEIPKPVAPPIKSAGPVVPAGPPTPPPPPPIPLKFYGFASRPGEAKKIFLSNGDDVFIGSEGEVINRRYRIVRITNSSVEIEDILNNNRQTIPLPQG